MKTLSDQTIIVTGAGSGIGRSTAQRLALDGAAVACVDITEPSLTTTVEGIAQSGGRSSSYVCDIADPGQVADTVTSIAASNQAIDGLVNVAGIGNLAHSTEQSPEEWSRIIQVNLSGTFFMCQQALPHLLSAHGRIINVASVSGLIGQPYNAAYCASKGGVIALTRALAVEYIDKGVTVNAIAPAGIETPLITGVEIPASMDPEKFVRLSSPLGLAQPEEVAGLIAFLLSPESRYMTGSIVTIDGGVSV
jgi:meso-butanediol dehydrogenase / (S,S)-butanediol dehydrogenase / diacetyl reductase